MMIGEGSEMKVFILFFLTVFVWKIISLGVYILYCLARNFKIIHTYV